MVTTTFVASTVIGTVAVLIFIRKYTERKWGICRNQVKLTGKIAIVTGANSGIGYEIAKELAQRNAVVVLACRTIEKAQDTAQRIKKEMKCFSNLVPMELELSSLNSVKNFADHFKKQFPKLNILVNNAGVSYPSGKRIESQDGFEIHFGVNHLAHFYLTNLLEEPLIKASGSRVIVITSALLEKGEIKLDDLNSKNITEPVRLRLYANSKLANAYFAKELAKRWKYKDINVYAVSPGWVYTGLFRYSLKWYHFISIAPIAFFFMRSAKQGAQTAIYCATEPELGKQTGLLYRDCKCFNSRQIFYNNIQGKLWEESERLISSVMKD